MMQQSLRLQYLLRCPPCSDLTETEQVSAGVERLGEYELHDMVQLDANTAGVIVKIQGHTAQVRAAAKEPCLTLCLYVSAARFQHVHTWYTHATSCLAHRPTYPHTRSALTQALSS